MDKPIKIFFCGIACTVLIAAAGFANTYRLESKLHQLELECVEQGKRDNKFGNLATLLCDAESLVNSSGTSKGVQAQIVQAQHDVWSSKEWPYVLAFLVFLLSAVPWVWYFLLRRIRELKDAIVGK